MCISMLAGVIPWSMAEADYWAAQSAYSAAVSSGDTGAIIKAVKQIEAVYPDPSTENEYLRLFYPILESAKIHEREGRYADAAKQYKKANNLANLLDEINGNYYDYAQVTEMLYVHNNVKPTVYAETSVKKNIPYYGARVEPKAGCYHGMTDYFDKSYDDAQILYVTFFDEDIEPFKWQLPTDTDDYTLMIGWNVPNEDLEDLTRIANGEADKYIRRNLEYLATLKCRILIRFGAEVNCWSSLPGSRSAYEADAGKFAETFKDAFRRVSTMARKYCPSAGMIFSPNDISNWFFSHEDFYPGDDYVDWVGMSAYNNRAASRYFEIGNGNDAYYCVGDYYENQITRIKSIVDSYGDRKPIIITEGGIAYSSKDGVQNEAHAMEGMRFFYTYVSRVYPQIKSIMYFNSNASTNKYSIFGLNESNETLGQLYRELNTSNVAMEYTMGRSKNCGYVPLEKLNEVTDELRLSVYAAYPTTEDVRVTYTLNGKTALDSTEYPYALNIKTDELGTGGHLLKVRVSCRNTETVYNYKITVTEEGNVSVSDAIPKTIKDVSKNFWGYDAVAFGMAKGLFNGTSDKTFEPNGKVTRAMFVTILARMTGVDAGNYTNTSFKDVPKAKWFAPYVEWAKSNGIVNGKTETHFAPNEMVTREQMCAILVRYCEIFGIDLVKASAGNRFNDHASISSYARSYVYTAKESGLVSGKNGNVFDPKSGATRAEAATIFMRFMINFK